MKLFNYSTEKYDFKKVLCDWLETDDLAQLHVEKQYPLLTREQDMYMHWNQIYYNRWIPYPNSLYLRLHLFPCQY